MAPVFETNPTLHEYQRRDIGAMLEALPKDRVAEFEYFEQAADGSTFVACRIPGDNHKVAELDDRQYKGLLYAAEGYSIDEIAALEDKSRGTIIQWLLEAREKLGVNETSEASSFIPIDLSLVQSLHLSKLSSAQAKVLDLVGSGLNVNEIASETGTSDSTVRTHRRDIANIFGIDRSNEIMGVGIRRLGGAVHVIDFQKEIISSVGSDFRPRVIELLGFMSIAEDAGLLPSLESETVHQMGDISVIRLLQKAGLIAEVTQVPVNLDLRGYVGAQLTKNAAASYLMTSADTKEIASTVLNQEVNHFLANRSAITPERVAA